jgi:hypothetical protein
MTVSRFNDELLKQCMHRFKALKAELSDAQTPGALPGVGFTHRLQRIQSLEKTIESLIAKRNISVQGLMTNHDSNMDLPVLSDCSHLEQRSILISLKETNTAMRQINKDAQNLYGKMRMSHMGTLGWIRAVFFLSWLRKAMSKLVKQLDAVRSMRRSLDHYVKHLSPSRNYGSTQIDIIDTFKEFEHSTSRIAQLKLRIQTENSRNKDQEEWLQLYESKRQMNCYPSSPPLPAEVNKLTYELSGQVMRAAESARDRLTIASRLVKALSEPLDDISTASRAQFESSLTRPEVIKVAKKKNRYKKKVGQL